jgi:hypothetical protein
MMPPGDAIVAAIHGVLHGVAQDQQKHEVERCHLADLPFSGEAEQHQQEHVNDDGPDHEMPPERQVDCPHNRISDKVVAPQPK